MSVWYNNTKTTERSANKMNFDKLKNLMDHLVEAGHAPGNTILVCLDGKPVFNYSCGYSDLKTKTPMTGKEHFNLYSCSKITTVVAALKLFEEGKFLMSDPLYEYIPEYKEMYIERADGEVVKAKNPIRIQNLFNMTAGYDYNQQTQAFAKAREITEGRMDTDVVARCLASDKLHFEPGERFQYSVCHDILAGLVSVITGKKFRDYVKENIFDPLGMDKSVYHVTPEIIKNMATQYKFVPEGASEDFDIVDAQRYGKSKDGTFVDMGPINHHIHGPEYDSGGSGITSTADDYIKLLSALANMGMGTNGERILSECTVELMRTNTLNEQQLKTFDWSQLVGYGYGFGVRTMMDRAVGGSLSNIGEFGWGGAAGASCYIDPKNKLSAIYLKHSLNPREQYYQPRVRNVIYSCLDE